MESIPDKGFVFSCFHRGYPKTLSRICQKIKNDYLVFATSSEDLELPETTEVTRLQEEFFKEALSNCGSAINTDFSSQKNQTSIKFSGMSTSQNSEEKEILIDLEK